MTHDAKGRREGNVPDAQGAAGAPDRGAGTSVGAGASRSSHVTSEAMPADARTADIPSVSIVMGTFQGEPFLRDQLATIAAQTHPHWTLLVSDDGSIDATREIVLDFASAESRRGRVFLRPGPRLGFATNFIRSLRDAPVAHYYAFSDQDDIWAPTKLERAIGRLRGHEAVPALYCGRSRVVDESGVSIGFSPLFRRRPSFANALVQSIAGGNTMVLNAAARDLIVAADVDEVVSHDWWAYLLVSGAGGEVIYDPEPQILYRQHGRNLVGVNTGLTSRYRRLQLLLSGRFRDWSEQNVRCLESASHLLTKQSLWRLHEFQKLRSAGVLSRLAIWAKIGLYRQTTIGNAGLLAAVIGNKI